MPLERPLSSRTLRKAWFLTIILGVGLAIATLTPGHTLPDAPPGGDKLHHALAFAVLMLPLTCTRPSAALWLAPAAAVFGGLIEYIQPFVGRSGDLEDLVADLIGIGAGVGAGCIFHRLRNGMRNYARDGIGGPPSS